MVLPAPAGGGASAVDGHWYRAPSSDGEARGALVLLHGCGGPWRGRAAAASGEERLDARLAEVVALAHRSGWHALVVDSFGPRGVREVCTQRLGTRAVTQRERRGDALAALAWLAVQPGVDADRLGLVGWSNGGSTVLAALDGGHPAVRAASARPAFALAHYPGCATEAARRWRPVAPLLMLLAEDDDWTPPQPCLALAASVGAGGGPAVDTVVYPGAVHGFDGTAARQRRLDVPNGVTPGAGVSVGRDPAAAADARRRLAALLDAHPGAAPAARP